VTNDVIFGPALERPDSSYYEDLNHPKSIVTSGCFSRVNCPWCMSGLTYPLGTVALGNGLWLNSTTVMTKSQALVYEIDSKATAELEWVGYYRMWSAGIYGSMTGNAIRLDCQVGSYDFCEFEEMLTLLSCDPDWARAVSYYTVSCANPLTSKGCVIYTPPGQLSETMGAMSLIPAEFESSVAHATGYTSTNRKFYRMFSCYLAMDAATATETDGASDPHFSAHWYGENNLYKYAGELCYPASHSDCELMNIWQFHPLYTLPEVGDFTTDGDLTYAATLLKYGKIVFCEALVAGAFTGAHVWYGWFDFSVMGADLDFVDHSMGMAATDADGQGAAAALPIIFNLFYNQVPNLKGETELCFTDMKLDTKCEASRKGFCMQVVTTSAKYAYYFSRARVRVDSNWAFSLSTTYSAARYVYPCPSECTATTFFEELLIGFPQDSCDRIRDVCCGAGCVDSAVFQEALPWNRTTGYCEAKEDSSAADLASDSAVSLRGGTQECALPTLMLLQYLSPGADFSEEADDQLIDVTDWDDNQVGVKGSYHKPGASEPLVFDGTKYPVFGTGSACKMFELYLGTVAVALPASPTASRLIDAAGAGPYSDALYYAQLKGESVSSGDITVTYGELPKPVREAFAGWDVPGQGVSPHFGDNEEALVSISESTVAFGPSFSSKTLAGSSTEDHYTASYAGEDHWCGIQDKQVVAPVNVTDAIRGMNGVAPGAFAEGNLYATSATVPGIALLIDCGYGGSVISQPAVLDAWEEAYEDVHGDDE
jgi:hypothetical protein